MSLCITILTLSLVNLLASRDREKYEQLVEDNYSVQEPKRVGVMQMSRVSSYSDCECDQQMQVGVYDLYALSGNWYGMCRPSSFAERQKDPKAISTFNGDNSAILYSFETKHIDLPRERHL